MFQRIVLLSGPIGAGKSTAANRLGSEFLIPVVSTRGLLKLATGLGDNDRKALQEAGAKLDNATDGRWTAEALVKWEHSQADPPDFVIVDSIRDRRQVSAFRALWPHAVTHIHIDAPQTERAARFALRGESASFESVSADTVELAVGELAAICDHVLDSSRNTVDDMVATISGIARLTGEHRERLVDVLIGGQWGSEGKGQVAAYLAPEYEVLVRVGGPNAGHSVYETGEPDKFFHLPSGTNRNPKARLVLGPGAVISVGKLLQEINDNEVEAGRLSIDPQAMVISEDDRQAEIRLVRSIGSTGQGVGYATSRKVLREGAQPRVELARDVADLRQYVKPTSDVLLESYRRRRRVFLEGTQGALLSLHHGSYPYVTSRDTTISGCLAECGIPPARVRRSVMVCRSYPIRVKNPDASGDGGEPPTSGPMGREIDWGEIARRSSIPQAELEGAEHTTTTNRLRRVAEFSWRDLVKAATLNGPTDVALTFVDYFGIGNRQARRFDQLNGEARAFSELVARVAGAPVSLLAVDFSHQAIIDRRRW